LLFQLAIIFSYRFHVSEIPLAKYHSTRYTKPNTEAKLGGRRGMRRVHMLRSAA